MATKQDGLARMPEKPFANWRNEMSAQQKVEVKTYEVHLMCDCGGEMRHTGMVLTSNPAQYPHKCEKCGATETRFDEIFPHIVYEKQP